MTKFTGLLFLILTFTISSCSTDSDSWTTDRDNLIGKWTGTASFEKTFEDGTKEIGERTVRIEFITNEKVVLKLNSFFNSTYDWIYQSSPEKIALINSRNFSRIPDLFDIINNDNNTQEWETSFEEYKYDIDNQTSELILVTEDWRLTRL